MSQNLHGSKRKIAVDPDNQQAIPWSTMNRIEQYEILKALPKVDLHRHLEGSIRIETLLEMGRKRGLDLPLESAEALAPHVTWQPGQPRSLKHFLTKFHADWYSSYSDVERISREAFEDAAASGVVYLELRFSPEHLSRHSGLSPEGTMEAVVESGMQAADDAGMDAGFIVTFTRERYDFDQWKSVINHAVELSDKGIVGVDLAGDEFAYPNRQFIRIMDRAHDTSVLNITIHAGEGTSAASVSSAVESLHAQRIGHGISAAEDSMLMQKLAQGTVTLEMCPNSNFQTGCVHELKDHPLPMLKNAGVRVCINSDDPAMHQNTLTDEYMVAVEQWGFGLEELFELEKIAVDSAFVNEALRKKIMQRVSDAYLSRGIESLK